MQVEDQVVSRQHAPRSRVDHVRQLVRSCMASRLSRHEPELKGIQSTQRINMLLLRMARYSLILIFAADQLGELIDGDPQLLPRWYIYLAMYVMASGLQRCRASAQPLIVAASGFLAVACLGNWLFDLDLGAADSVTTIAVIALLGMLNVALQPRRSNTSLVTFAIVIAVTAYATAVMDQLALDEVIMRTVSSSFGLVLGGWALGEMRGDLETMIKSKDAFIASVSHELRTPLTGTSDISRG